MTDAPLDAIIFGGGLAGSTLAKQMIDLGKRIVVIDNPNRSSCSRVAAGLINPIGGKRMNLVWMAEELIPFAKKFYLEIENKSGKKIFYQRPMARLMQNPLEIDAWAGKAEQTKYKAWIDPLEKLDIPKEFLSKQNEGFAIHDSGFLDTNAFLDHTKEELAEHYETSDFDYGKLKFAEDIVTYDTHKAQYAIFCDGHLARQSPFFKYVPFRPVKGVIGTIQTSRKLGETIILKGRFLIPLGDGKAKIGATYNWDDPTDIPDQNGIDELETFLNKYLESDWKWLEIQAGVRPATAGAYPVIGPSRQSPRILSFNGFGSKGSMQIPFLAKSLIDFIDSAKPIPEQALASRFDKTKEPTLKRWRAVDVAKERSLQHLSPNGIAIDATAGNGHDALWIAQAIGKNGQLYIFDLQEKAIANTKERLANSRCPTPRHFFQISHDKMADHVPAALHQKVDLVVFNLGYLPGGDKSIITKENTTINALSTATALLKPGGLLSVVLYPAHKGGGDESKAVIEWHKTLDAQLFETEVVRHPAALESSPFPIFVKKRA